MKRSPVQGILAAVKAGVEASDLPKPAPDEPGRQGNGALSELLRVLLKAKADAAGVAPRLIASNPRAPEPAYRSMTRSPCRLSPQAACSSTLNTAWRARSEVGRVPCPSGATMARPFRLPATIRMDQPRGVRGLPPGPRPLVPDGPAGLPPVRGLKSRPAGLASLLAPKPPRPAGLAPGLPRRSSMN